MKKILITVSAVVLLASAQAGWSQTGQNKPQAETKAAPQKKETKVRLSPEKVDCLSRSITAQCKQFEVTVPTPKVDTVLKPVTNTVVDTAAIRSALRAQLDSINKARASLEPAVQLEKLKASHKRTALRQCILGTQYAINKNRQVLPGEVQFATDRDLTVRINRHRAPGSTDIVWEECILPKGEMVVCSAGGCWVKKCGNDLEGVAYSPPSAALPPGLNGLNGINCWDTNMNGSNDPNEDVNGDGSFDARDCRGQDGQVIERTVSIPHRGLCSGKLAKALCIGVPTAVAVGAGVCALGIGGACRSSSHSESSSSSTSCVGTICSTTRSDFVPEPKRVRIDFFGAFRVLNTALSQN